MAVFGKRNPATAKPTNIPRPSPDPDGVTRLIPKEIFSGPHGNMLRELGLGPDDPSNLVPTQESIDAEFARRRAQQDQFLEKVNARPLGGAKVTPFAMLPWTVWRSDHASFLMISCDYYPVDPWNTALLPQDEDASIILGLPKHPGGYPTSYEAACIEAVGKIRRDHQEVYQTIYQRMQQGDQTALQDHAASLNRTKSSVYAHAHTLFSMLFGEDVYKRHNKLFGEVLSHSII
ncbi:hypothetical protein [Roseibium sp. MMSF_3544]|uniref:hypothetical protein n=1 Tax=unclassified Roseibium TaxID=2629323 RepID=UPI00273DCD0C|nr:hypothetical protein [Roseibium sp. MMSF_3544]